MHTSLQNVKIKILKSRNYAGTTQNLTSEEFLKKSKFSFRATMPCGALCGNGGCNICLIYYQSNWNVHEMNRSNGIMHDNQSVNRSNQLVRFSDQAVVNKFEASINGFELQYPKYRD